MLRWLDRLVETLLGVVLAVLVLVGVGQVLGIRKRGRDGRRLGREFLGRRDQPLVAEVLNVQDVDIHARRGPEHVGQHTLAVKEDERGTLARRHRHRAVAHDFEPEFRFRVDHRCGVSPSSAECDRFPARWHRYSR